ncbi:hypothetical protein [Nocardioides sp. AX2bis]|uniref:hypothetical protein n=1 Tax=Nocardioides sp. AX2bis TaxID=2653157 RepID=UPI0012F13899|nr:hypothetical protein [Nocardioides sp. AX2bis]VXC43883.1 hypothetical protein NOCARDAX2BIS_590006 [Nocardioides sp. AX2bis]
MPYISQNSVPRGPKGKPGGQGADGTDGERGPAGYNATGAAEDQETLAAYVVQDADPNPFGEALLGRFARYDTDPDGTLVIVTGDSGGDGGDTGGGDPGTGGSFDDAAATSAFLAAVDF